MLRLVVAAREVPRFEVVEVELGDIDAEVFEVVADDVEARAEVLQQVGRCELARGLLHARNARAEPALLARWFDI